MAARQPREHIAPKNLFRERKDIPQLYLRQHPRLQRSGEPLVKHPDVEYRSERLRFLQFEPAIRIDFIVLLPSRQHRPPVLVYKYVQYVREHIAEQVSPAGIFPQ